MNRMINHDETVTLNILKLIKQESDKFNEFNYTPETIENSLEEAA